MKLTNLILNDPNIRKLNINKSDKMYLDETNAKKSKNRELKKGRINAQNIRKLY